ncbi:Receptor-like protein kinase [Zostera marina]|uniref:non-specific serine/threonine protein kinase n=1 Tax=Zostera marina TaxID=29655 RepID=A0A0K9PZS4_ZOSMR|nr:Receptor-like protein kinase [Zostera marina]
MFKIGTFRLIFLLLRFRSISSLQFSDEEEKGILLRIKSAWNDPVALASWTNITSNGHCGWTGVTCTNGTVTGISLVSKSIEGGVPEMVCELKNLTTLDLSDNFIGGSFPTSLYQCSNLQDLNLYDNLLVGLIPDDIDRLSRNLVRFSIGGNNFTGEIPDTIVRVGLLEELILDNNLFNGSFPAMIGNISGLQKLTLADNYFVPGSIPMEFFGLKKLRYFSSYLANLMGEIPMWLGELSELKYLDLHKNDLTGSIPPGIWKLKNLTALYLYGNRLDGEISPNISALNLLSIDISRNRLTGKLPEDMEKLQKLENLFLYSNKFFGSIPNGIGRISTLFDVRFFNNTFSGELPPDLGKFSNLWNLEVEINRFSGELPRHLCKNQKLNSLIVFSNHFKGSIPDSLGNCSTLVDFQLQYNNFSGELPMTFWKMSPLLSKVRMTGNEFYGELPRQLPQNLTTLEIENNKFTGTIPSSAINLTQLKVSNNLFSGELPSDFRRLSSLQELHLDQNLITGDIPTSIKLLSKLTDLNLSSNRLTGIIPEEIGLLPVLTYLDISNNSLHGEIPKLLGNLNLNILNLSSNSLSGKIPSPFQNTAYDRSFLSNAGLCSTQPGFNLSFCSTKPKSSNNLSRGLIALFVILGVIVLVSSCIVTFFIVRKNKWRKEAVGDGDIWKRTDFFNISFTETTILQCLVPENIIGSGGFGEVYRIALNDQVIAVKKLRKSSSMGAHKIETQFRSEVEILGSIRHRNIVKLFCYITGPNTKLLVYEHLANKSLDRWIHGNQNIGLDWPTRLRIATEVAQGLCYMHHNCNPPVIHRDLKSSNILLDHEFNSKVADFGLAKLLVQSSEASTTSTLAGSIGYMAPECAFGKKTSEKIDVYSFGVVLFELVTGKDASNNGNGVLVDLIWANFQEGRTMMELADQKIKDPKNEDEITSVFRLGLMCTGTMPSSRPSMKVVLETLLQCAGLSKFSQKTTRDEDGLLARMQTN